MRVHHLDCCTMCPVGGSWLNGHDHLAGHVLLIEGAEGLVLVDSGIGTRDVDRPARLGLGFERVVRPVLDLEATARHQVRRLGFDPRDVRHVICTHLDVDHAGGIADFPEAEVHVLSAEHRAALHPSLHDRVRYRADHFAHGPRWRLHDPTGEAWMGFAAVRDAGLGPDLLLVPLVGHTHGHMGVAVRTGTGWLLHCGDAYFHRREVDPEDGGCPPGLRLIQRLDAVDRRRVRENKARLRELRRSNADIRTVCAHDPVELDGCRSA